MKSIHVLYITKDSSARRVIWCYICFTWCKTGELECFQGFYFYLFACLFSLSKLFFKWRCDFSSQPTHFTNNFPFEPNVINKSTSGVERCWRLPKHVGYFMFEFPKKRNVGNDAKNIICYFLSPGNYLSFAISETAHP